jgi:hypothetical protein
MRSIYYKVFVKWAGADRCLNWRDNRCSNSVFTEIRKCEDGMRSPRSMPWNML